MTRPAFFALSGSGQLLATIDVDGATAVDWEDIAVGPPSSTVAADRSSSTGQTLYLADIGDNGRSRRSITVYRTPEPAVDPSSAGTTAHVTADALSFTYPDGPHDAEALMVDPRSGDLVIVTKDWSLGGHSQVFRAPGDRPAGSTTVLEQVATVDLPAGTLVTGADVSADGAVGRPALLHGRRPLPAWRGPGAVERVRPAALRRPTAAREAG